MLDMGRSAESALLNIFALKVERNKAMPLEVAYQLLSVLESRRVCLSQFIIKHIVVKVRIRQ